MRGMTPKRLAFNGVGIVLLFLVLYVVLLLSSTLLSDKAKETLVQFSHGGHGSSKAAVPAKVEAAKTTKTVVKREILGFPHGLSREAKVGLVNIAADETDGWRAVEVQLQRVPENLRWELLFPEWIDEDETKETPSCPEIPMPDFSRYEEVDAVVARLPCQYPDAGWARDVFRLQVHLAAANLAARRARRDREGRVQLIFLSQCQPMMELFRAGELVEEGGGWWFYRSDARRLLLKVSLPVGSCRLALPPEFDGKLGNDSKRSPEGPKQREAYATVLHTSQEYICGAIVLAHSIRRSGSSRDLILLHDKNISGAKLAALAAAGWKPRIIDRIRNPRAVKDAYNEYNYSKFRLWQLTDYDKVVFLDTDALVLRNIDRLFRWPEMSAAGNDGWMFNSGVIVVEPSNATFTALMSRRDEIISYNGGDQGFLNEVFVWWHRLPRRANFLKVYSAKASSSDVSRMKRFFRANPPELSVVHYLGRKPWQCYRDYDCNWNKPGGRIYADDAAHRSWWRLHDGIKPGLKRFCGMPNWRKAMLEGERSAAEVAGNADGHWKIRIADKRKSWEP